MFFRQKQSGTRRYLQSIENPWAQGRSRQSVTAMIGGPDELQLPQIIAPLLAGRRFDLPTERILFLTVLHRLLDPGTLDHSPAVSHRTSCPFVKPDAWCHAGPVFP
mgnify:CR=1 FL=1